MNNPKAKPPNKKPPHRGGPCIFGSLVRDEVCRILPSLLEQFGVLNKPIVFDSQPVVASGLPEYCVNQPAADWAKFDDSNIQFGKVKQHIVSERANDDVPLPVPLESKLCPDEQQFDEDAGNIDSTFQHFDPSADADSIFRSANSNSCFQFIAENSHPVSLPVVVHGFYFLVVIPSLTHCLFLYFNVLLHRSLHLVVPSSVTRRVQFFWTMLLQTELGRITLLVMIFGNRPFSRIVSV